MAILERIARLKVLLPLIGIAIFIYIIKEIGTNNIINALCNINPVLFAISLLIFVPRIIISTYRWKMIADIQGIIISLPSLIKLNLIGLFYGTITPLWLGDYIRIPYLREETGEPFGKCASNIIIDQIMEFSSLFILAVIGSAVLVEHFPSLFFILFSIFVIFVSVTIFLKKKKRSEKFFRIIYKIFIPEKLKSSVANEFDAFYRDMPALKSLMLPLLIGLFSYALYFAQIYIIALSFSVDIPFATFILIYPVASLIGLIPITVSGLGTREAALIHIFSIYGIPSNITVAISLSGYVITMLIPSIIGGILAVTRIKSAEKV